MSTIRAARISPSLSICFLYSRETFCQLLSAFCATWRTSINFHQLFLWLGDFPTTFVNFFCHQETFREIPSLSLCPECLRQLPPTFRAARTLYVNFCQYSVQPGDLLPTYINFPCSQWTLCQLPSTFRVARRLPSTSINLTCSWESFRQLLSTFRTARRPSINLLQLFGCPGDHLSTSVNFLCCLYTFCQLLSIFRAAGRPSVNFPKVSLQPEDLPSTFSAAGIPTVNIPYGWETFRQLPSNFLAAG